MGTRPSWIKEKKIAKDFEIINCKPYDNYKDFRMDNGCYVLIKIYKDNSEIGVAICNYDHEILKEFRGKKAQDIYHEIFEYDKKNDKKWFTLAEHAAYLGKELKKAEIALASSRDYCQE